MATPPRYFEDEAFYHVYNRGNRKEQIFIHDRDYERFLEKVVEYKNKFLVNILAFCLMPNHFHFLIQQLSQNSISQFFSNLCNSHSRYFNIKYETVGSLFQGRFKSKKIEKDEYLVHLSRYIHLNPLELFKFTGNELIKQLLSYRWSSLPHYLTFNNENNKMADSSLILNYFSKKDPVLDYKNFIFANIQLKVNPIISHLTFEE